MRRTVRAAVLLAAVVMVLGSAVVAQAKSPALKKSHVTLSANMTLSGTAVTGTFSGSLGKGKVTGKSDLPVFILTFHAKGGTVTMSFKGAPNNSGQVPGKWTWRGGTGKYRQIKGKGSGTGTPTGANGKTFVFKFSGTD